MQPNDLILQSAELESKGERAAAIQLLREAAHSYPDNGEVVLRLANLLLRDGQVESAIERLKNLIARTPSYPRAHYWLGKALLLARKDIDEALVELRIAIAQEPNWHRGYDVYADALLEAGQLVEAKQAYENARELLPDDPHYHWAVGDLCEELEMYDEAIQCFKSALQLEPNDPFYYRALGNFHLNRGDLASAYEVFEDGLKRIPSDEDLFRAAAEVKMLLHQPNKAQTILRNALNLNPRSVVCWYEFGLASLANRDAASAIEALESLRELDGEVAEELDGRIRLAKER